jgi:hypothetical protein
MKLIVAGLFFGLLAAHAAIAGAQDAQSAQLDLTLIPTSIPTQFRAELHNPGTTDLVLNLGIVLANGAKQYVDRVRFTLTMPGGKVFHLDPAGPAFIAGRLDPLIVPLPAGATFSFPIDLKKCTASKEKNWQLTFPQGRYELRAQYTGERVPFADANLDVKGIALMTFWTGNVQSSPLAFTVP